MKFVAKVAVAALLAGMMSALQGCGCDEAAVKKCSGTSCKEMTKCWNDAGCCDYEKDGTKAKDLAKTMCAAASGDNQCA